MKLEDKLRRDEFWIKLYRLCYLGISIERMLFAAYLMFLMISGGTITSKQFINIILLCVILSFESIYK